MLLQKVIKTSFAKYYVKCNIFWKNGKYLKLEKKNLLNYFILLLILNKSVSLLCLVTCMKIK